MSLGPPFGSYSSFGDLCPILLVGMSLNSLYGSQTFILNSVRSILQVNLIFDTYSSKIELLMGEGVKVARKKPGAVIEHLSASSSCGSQVVTYHV